MRWSYTFKSEPKGILYKNLIDYALKECSFFQFVNKSRKGDLSSKAEEVLEKLSLFLLEIIEADEWPGTKIFEGKAKIHRYIFNYASAKVLKELAGGLYDWQSPDYPDDLAFIRADDSPWLVNIAHEEDSYLCLSKIELQRVQRHLAELADRLTKDKEIAC